MILADTSVWVEHYRSRASEAARELASLLRRDQVAMTGVVLAEVIEGSRSQRQAAQISKDLSSLLFIDVSLEDWVRAGNLSCELRRQGVTIPLADLVIATVASRSDLSLFTLDKHFERVPGLRLHTPGQA